MTTGVCRECWSQEVNGDVDQSDGLFYCVACWHAFDAEQQKRQCNMTDRLLSSGGKNGVQFATDKGNQTKKEAKSKARMLDNKQPEASPNQWQYQHEEADRTVNEHIVVEEKTTTSVHTRKQAKTEKRLPRHSKRFVMSNLHVCERGCGFEGVFSAVEAHQQVCRYVRIDAATLSSTSAAAAVLPSSTLRQPPGLAQNEGAVGRGFGGGGGGGAGGEEGDGDADQDLLEAVLKASLDTPQPAMDDEVILHLSLLYTHVLQVSL
jgi:hypothetical protein